MRAAAATALSAVVLLTPGCGPSTSPRQPDREEPVRRASFRSVAARDYLATCPGAAARAETIYQVARHEELRQLAARNGAGRAIALGENEWAGLGRYARRRPCTVGEAPYRQALSEFSGALDTLATRIAEHPTQKVMPQ